MCRSSALAAGPKTTSRLVELQPTSNNHQQHLSCHPPSDSDQLLDILLGGDGGGDVQADIELLGPASVPPPPPAAGDFLLSHEVRTRQAADLLSGRYLGTYLLLQPVNLNSTGLQVGKCQKLLFVLFNRSPQKSVEESALLTNIYLIYMVPRF